PHPWHSRAGGGAVHSINKRLMHCSKLHHYSITSSARTSKEGGTVRPSSLAVLRLIISSNLVGCSTGRSEGLVPLRILSTIDAPRPKGSALAHSQGNTHTTAT